MEKANHQRSSIKSVDHERLIENIGPENLVLNIEIRTLLIGPGTIGYHRPFHRRTDYRLYPRRDHHPAEGEYIANFIDLVPTPSGEICGLTKVPPLLLSKPTPLIIPENPSLQREVSFHPEDTSRRFWRKRRGNNAHRRQISKKMKQLRPVINYHQRNSGR